MKCRITLPQMVHGKSFTGKPRLTQRRWLEALLVCSGLLLSLYVNYHSYLANFNLVPGDRGDTRLVIFTLEHWVKVLTGHEGFYALQMFYPDPHALGYADGLFLFAIPYAVFRAAGIDPFTSYQLFFIIITVIGYVAWIALLRNNLELHLGFAVLGAILLTILNSLQSQAQIGKLTGFNLIPVLVGLLIYYLRATNKHSWMAAFALWAFAALLSLYLFTSYYPAWFFLFTLALFAAFQFGVICIRRGPSSTIRCVIHFVAGNWGVLLGAAAIFALALGPFLTTYGPLIASNRQRSYNLALEFSPAIKDIVNVSHQNLIWSPILDHLGFDFGSLEVQMGSPAIVLALSLFATVYLVRRWIRARANASDPRDQHILLLVATALVILGITIRFQDVSAWHLIHAVVPGASALRAIGRYLIVVDMIAILTAIYGLNEWITAVSSRSARPQPFLAMGLGIMAAVLIAEQINLSPFRLDKAGQLALIERYKNPGTACRAFFISNSPQGDIDIPFGQYHLDAMMISMETGIPTVNGYSGFEPHKAFTLATTGVEYQYRILDWLMNNGAEEEICELNMQTGVWRQIDVMSEYRDYEERYREGILADFGDLYNAAGKFLEDGNSISDLYPQFLEEKGYLDPAFGYGTSIRYKWMKDRYWIGDMSCGNYSCVGIRVIGKAIELRPILEAYAGSARRVLFPEPAVWHEGAELPRDVESQLLMLFRFDAAPP